MFNEVRWHLGGRGLGGEAEVDACELVLVQPREQVFVDVDRLARPCVGVEGLGFRVQGLELGFRV